MKAFLQRILAEVPPTDDVEPLAEISVPRFLADLARRWPDAPRPADIAGLEALCRNIDVAGRIWLAYDVDWRQPTRQEAMAVPFAALLVAVLVATASSCRNGSGKERGIGLKFVNSAYKAIDIWSLEEGHPAGPELGHRADDVLGNLLA